MDFKKLFSGKWISIVSPVNEEYESVHEKDIIIVLPIIEKNGKKLYGIRYEHCPPYYLKDNKVRNYYTVLSGKIEEGEEPSKTVVRELEEESGVKALVFELKNIAENIPICKSTDMRAYVYVMRISEYERVEAIGDGTKSEELSKTVWVSEENLHKLDKIDNKDFLLVSLLKFI